VDVIILVGTSLDFSGAGLFAHNGVAKIKQSHPTPEITAFQSLDIETIKFGNLEA
jgi:hypothetical protein